MEDQKNLLTALAVLVFSHLVVSLYMLYSNMRYRDVQLYSWVLSFVVCLVLFVLVLVLLNRQNKEVGLGEGMM
jgi:uncharacterized protein YacL